jgi:hypothetical protein
LEEHEYLNKKRHELCRGLVMLDAPMMPTSLYVCAASSSLV